MCLDEVLDRGDGRARWIEREYYPRSIPEGKVIRPRSDCIETAREIRRRGVGPLAGPFTACGAAASLEHCVNMTAFDSPLKPVRSSRFWGGEALSPQPEPFAGTLHAALRHLLCLIGDLAEIGRGRRAGLGSLAASSAVLR